MFRVFAAQPRIPGPDRVFGTHKLDLPDGEDYVRGVGVVDMAGALSTGATVQASGALGYQVLEVLSAVDSSSADRRLVPMLGLAAVEASGRVPAN